MKSLNKKNLKVISGAGDWHPPLLASNNTSVHQSSLDPQSGFKVPQFVINGIAGGASSTLGQSIISPPEHPVCNLVGSVAGSAAGISAGAITRNPTFGLSVGVAVGSAATASCNSFFNNQKNNF